MTNTDNYNLNLIEDTDLVDFAPLNSNATIIDTKLKEVADAAASIPTIQTAVADNSSDITALQTRVGEAESDIAANITEINGVKNVNTAQWTAINTQSANLGTANTKITALENLAGDLLKFEQGSWILNPTIKKKLTFISTGGGLDYEGKYSAVIPAENLPATFDHFFVNASVCSVTNNDNIKSSLILNRAYIATSGQLVIEFKSIKGLIVNEGTETYYDLNDPSVNNLTCMAEIIFI